MNLVYQIIERNANDASSTVRYTTDKVSADRLDPQMEGGAIKLRPDGLVARCQGDLCMQLAAVPANKLQAVMVRYAPVDILYAAELALDANASPDITSVTALPEQSIVLA